MKIVVELAGGTGNQLFQLAYGLARAKALGLDPVHCVFLSTNLAKTAVQGGISPLMKDLLPSCSPRGCVVVRQRGWAVKDHQMVQEAKEKEATDAGRNLLLTGYYQSSKFFKDASSILMTLLAPRLTTDHRIPPTTLSIHVRRGDYLKLPNHHPFLDKPYYLKALECLSPLSPRKVMVFSDDLEWCRAQDWLKDLGDVAFVDEPVDKCLAAMQQCDAHIIANSTMSWWGAYLASLRNPDVQVIAPKTWFGRAIRHPTSDMYEAHWICV